MRAVAGPWPWGRVVAEQGLVPATLIPTSLELKGQGPPCSILTCYFKKGVSSELSNFQTIFQGPAKAVNIKKPNDIATKNKNA